jgi:UDP-N-acetylmuramate dehydrogenase
VRIRPDVPLASLTTLRVGGAARLLMETATAGEVVAAVTAADRSDDPVLVLGGGSNLLVADTGFPGTVVRIATRGVDAHVDAQPDDDAIRLVVQAGEAWDAVVDRAVAEGWAGIEALSGIPGTTGATPIQNVGAYGQEVSETIRRVRVFDRSTGAVRDLRPADCGFSYRRSRFKQSARHVVLEVEFRLIRSGLSAPVRYAELAGRLGVEGGARAPLAAVREAVLALRRGKGMVIDPADPDSVSAGSFFTNPVLSSLAAATLPADAPRWPQDDGRVKTSAAWLIEHAGFAKGHGNGRAGISSKHTLALTNRGGATAADLLRLAREVRDGVRAKFGVELTPEPGLVGLAL